MKLEQMQLPPRLEELLRGTKHRFVHAPFSGAFTFHIRGAANAYLKILPLGHQEPLMLYRDKLQWLSGRLPVPEVLLYETDERYEYLLMTEIAGSDATDEQFRSKAEQTVSLLAEGLRAIHHADARGCPFDCGASGRLRLIERRLSTGRIDRQKIEERFQDTPERLYERLCAELPDMAETSVLCHGDYCVPNVMIDSGRISGFIDLADAGLSDPYRDLAAAQRSIARNFGERHVALFYRKYGMEPDPVKLRLYDLMEHLAW